MTLQSVPLRRDRGPVEVTEIYVGGEGNRKMPPSLCIRIFVEPGAPTMFGISWSVLSPRQGYCLKLPKYF